MRTLGQLPLAATMLLLAAGAQANDADLLVYGGPIITVDATDRVVDAMAVAGDRILAVGSLADVAPHAGPATVRIDLRGRAVIPGLIDTHTHALEWATGVVRGELDLGFPRVRTVGDVQAAIADRLRNRPRGEWITGGGWDDTKLAERRYLTRADLDAVAPDNPVILSHVSGHLSVVNSAALRLAGITADTVAPQGGRIDVDEHGEPSGVLKDTASRLVYGILPQRDHDDARQIVDFVSRAAAEAGLTTIHDVALTPEQIARYRQAHTERPLRIRVRMAPLVGEPRDVDRLQELGVHTGSGDAHLRFGYAKMFTDGGMGAGTIAIYPPGIGDGSNTGLLVWRQDELESAQQRLARMGWQLGTHAIGDRAIDLVLDSYAKVAAGHPGRDLRPRIIHCGVATPAIQRRLAEGRVLVDSNPPFVYWIGDWFAKYGAQRVRWSYPAKSYFDHGILVSAGSDVNVTPLSPWWGIWAAVERRVLANGEVLAPEERVTVRQALRMYTINGAYAGFEERDTGSLEPGKLADFVMLDRDPLGIPAAQLKDVRVLATFVGGEAVFDAGAAGTPAGSATVDR